MKEAERIAKRLARSGICSRREAEKLILSGAVSVNGTVINTPALNVLPSDKISVHGKPLPKASSTRLWLYHKPVGLVTSHKDELGRPTVFDALKEELPRVISVGRLDLNTEGLLLLTNDGELARSFELPSRGFKRVYRVRVYGLESPEMLNELIPGVTIDGLHYAPCDMELEQKKGRNAWVRVTLTEGKNREIRKLFEHIGCTVSRLIRISYGPHELADLPVGKFKEVPKGKW